MSEKIKGYATTEQATALQTSIGRWVYCPQQRDRPMLVDSIDMSGGPDGTPCVIRCTLADDVDGEWILNGIPHSLTEEKLVRLFTIFTDRFLSMLRKQDSEYIDALDLDDLEKRKDILVRTAVVVRASLLEEGLEPVGEIEMKLACGMRTLDGVPERILFPVSDIVVRRGEREYHLQTPVLPGDELIE